MSPNKWTKEIENIREDEREKRLKSGKVKIIRTSDPMTDRYEFDFKLCTYKNGWAQVDTKQDASYYGTWANPFERKIVNYCEGDITITECEDDESFIAEILEMKHWNDTMGFWKGIDGMCNESTINRFKELGLESLLH